jgi:Family of unknown function (DUF6600)
VQQQQQQEKPIMVGRISYAEGQLLRYVPAEKDWVATTKDVPFGQDDALYSEEKSKAEFIMPNNTWVRTDGSTQIQMIKLAEDTTEIDIASGEARFYNKSSTALIKATTPFGYVVAGSDTVFDLYVGDKSVEVISLGGKVDYVHPSSAEKYEVVAGSPSILADSEQITSGEGKPDPDWDDWNAGEDELWARRLGMTGDSLKYLPPSLHDHAWELEENGGWERVYYDGAYRYFWRPFHIAPGWAPFTVGRWANYYGDSFWIPDEPFGYVCHHYGNWIFAHNFWYWAPPVFRARVSIGLPLPPPLPFLLPIPFFWCPGRVSWIFSPGFVGWCPLAPFEPFFCHHFFGPNVFIINEFNSHRFHTDIEHVHHIDHAVIVHDHDFFSVRNYNNVRISNINKTTIINNYHTSPVVNDTVIKNYSTTKERFNFTSEKVTMKPYQDVVNRIQQNEIAARRAGRENPEMIRQDLGRFREGRPVAGSHVQEPRLSNKLMPEGEVGKSRHEVTFPERELKRGGPGEPGMGQPGPARPEHSGAMEERIRPPRPRGAEGVVPASPEGPGGIQRPPRPERPGGRMEEQPLPPQPRHPGGGERGMPEERGIVPPPPGTIHPGGEGRREFGPPREGRPELPREERSPRFEPQPRGMDGFPHGREMMPPPPSTRPGGPERRGMGHGPGRRISEEKPR